MSITLPRFLIIAGLVLVLVVIPVFKEEPQLETVSGVLAEGLRQTLEMIQGSR